ncbi:MAG: ABC transporter permease [Alphaproteobacteria bacterium]
MNPKLAQRIAPWAATALLLVVWEVACRAFAVKEFVLPTPSASLAELWNSRAVIVHFAWPTLWVTLAGFAVAVVFGIFLGVVTGASALTYAALYPMLIGFNSIPKVAIVPVLVVWFGFGIVPGVLTAFLISFFPIVVNVATGLATLEPELRDVLRSLGARPIDILLKVGLPRAMPYFFASLKVAVTLAFVGTIIAETMAGNQGIGNMMQTASSNFNVPLVFAGLIVVAVMGVGMYAAFAWVEKRMTGWAYRGGGGVG